MNRPLFAPEFWPTALGAFLLALGILTLGWVGLLLAVAGVLLLVRAAEGFTPGRLKLLGPIFVWEVIRQTRKQPIFRGRVGYLVILLGLLACVWAGMQANGSRGRLPEERQLQVLAATFLIVQFAAVILLTPALVAGVFTDEKESRTLDFVLMTDLRTQEIVLGKLAARMALPLQYLLAGAPLLALVPVLGGLSLSEVGLYLSALLASLLSAVAYSGIVSLAQPQTKKAIGAAFGGMIGLHFLVGYGRLFPHLTAFLGLTGWPQLLVEHLTLTASLFNPLVVFLHTKEMMDSGSTLESAIWWSVLAYTKLHALAALGILTMLLAELRSVVAAAPEQQVKEATEPSILPFNQVIQRPPVHDWPLMWREWYAPQKRPQRQWERRFVQFVFLLSLVGLAVLVPIAWISPWLGRFVNNALTSLWNMAAIGPIVVAAVAVLSSSNRASFTVVRDREQKVLEEILQTPLDEREILTQKWWGCVGHTRYAYLWGAIVWGLLALVNPLLALLLLPTFAVAAVHTLFGCNLGLYYSTRHTTGPKANGWLVGTGILLNFAAPIPLVLLATLPTTLGVTNTPLLVYYTAFMAGLALGLSPVAALASTSIFAFTVSIALAGTRPSFRGEEVLAFLFFGLGLALTTAAYALLSRRVFTAAVERFAWEFRPRPERRLPPENT
jgi:ABC-type transport system involved in multi-copper enzyme maturation permease subunit